MSSQSRFFQSNNNNSSSTDNNDSSNVKLLAAVGGSIVFSGLAMSYYYSKKLKQQENEFNEKFQQLIQQQNKVPMSSQFSARIAPGPVPSLQLSSPVFAPLSNPNSQLTHQGSTNQLSSAITASPRLMPNRRSAVVVVDPVSTGANVAHEVTRRGIPCIRVMSGKLNRSIQTFCVLELLLFVETNRLFN